MTAAWRSKTLPWIAVLALILSGLALGCSDDKKDDGTTPRAVEDLPALTLTDDTGNLLLTWLDDKGDAHTEVALADVPAQGKALVRVVIADKKEGQGSRFYVADLTKKRGDGSYEVRTMSRLEWEGIIGKRRSAYLAKHAPPPPKPTAGPSGAPPGTPPTATAARGDVAAIVYGASWCGPCHAAQRFLKKRGASVTYKDIERDPKAAAEMRHKLKRVGRSGASIPVIDVDGQILIGYSASALDKALKKARGGTRI